MGILNSEKDRLLEGLASDGSICYLCAELHGAVWPEGHCATFWGGQCSICLTQKTSCCAVSDYDWPNKNVKLDREI